MDISQKILSDIVTWSKYSKFIQEINRRETWEEICERTCAMHVRKYPQLKDEIQYTFNNYVKTKKVLASMRSMQFGGAPIELSNGRIFNCAYQPIDHIDVFSETMHQLLSGTGVGYSVQKHHVAKLPVIIGIKPKTRRFLVGDSIEGWADAIKVLVEAFFLGKSDPILDYRDIRPKGARLVTSGGKAPGPAPLRICIEYIRAILSNATGRKLYPLEAHSIQCHIADAVLSGGIRRAAMISLFSKDDMYMMASKSGSWWELNPHFGRANNSVVLERSVTTDEEFFDIWERIEASNAGEPGIFWTDDLDMGTNPCCLSGDTNIQVCYNGGPRHAMHIKDVIALVTSGIDVNVLSWNDNDYCMKKIISGDMTRKDANLVKISTRYDSVICTPDHKIYTVNRGYVEASQLQLDDTLLINGTNVNVESNVSMDYTEDVYDIEVESSHCFFANNILVHNCEVSLMPSTFCNLTEVDVSNITSQEELNDYVKIGSFLGTLQAGYTDFHYLRPEWKDNTERDALIGVSMTGIGSGKVLAFNLVEAANVVKTENERVSKLIGINVAARTTVNKPSGCLNENTKIKTNKGVLTLRQIFDINDVVPDNSNIGFIAAKEELYVYDMNNELQQVTKLFNNGIVDTIKIEFEDGNFVECTSNHKFLTNNGWKRCDELEENDDVIGF